MGFFSRVKNNDQPKTGRYFYAYSGGTAITPETSMEVSAYYRAVIYLSTQIAKLPWLIKDQDNKRHYNRIYKLLNIKPNGEMTAFTMKCLMVQMAIHKGNAYAEIERDAVGRPVWLWPLDTERICPIRDEKGRLWYYASGGGRQGVDTILDPENVLHFKNFHTLDGLTGMSTIAYAREALGISKGADTMANSLFANGGMPSGVLTTTGRLSNEAVERMKKGWKSAHGGTKAGGIAVLEEGTTYSPISISPEDLQFLESRKFSVPEIARFMGVPPIKLYDNEKSTFNNVEHSNIEVVTDTLDAWSRNLESEVDCKLLFNSRENLKSEMDISAIFRGDMNTRANYFTKMMQTGAMSPNEIREKEGLEPYDGGSRFFIATNNFTPADRIDEVIDSQVKKKPQSGSGEESDEEELNKAVLNYLKR